MENQNIEEKELEVNSEVAAETGITEEAGWTYEENLDYAQNHIYSCLKENRLLMKDFKSKKYEAAFMNYVAFCRPVFEAINRAYMQEPEKKDEIFDQTIGAFLKGLDKDVKNMNKLARMNYVDESKFIIALYFVPAVDYMQLSAGDEWIDCFIEKWIETHPKNVIRRGNFDQIMNGFRNKRYCYITTAVCETMGKDDECYELTMFRMFRDGYLANQPDGQALIEQYYREAPLVVKAIDDLPESAKIYESIWDKHLSPCLQAIEEDREQDCKEYYTNMVEELKKLYL